MGAGSGNFSYSSLDEYRAKASGEPYLRDTSVVFPGLGQTYNNSKAATGIPAGWRLLRIRVENP
jgi:hypothetical protein